MFKLTTVFSSTIILLVGWPFLSGVENSTADLLAQGPGTEMTQIINRVGLGSDCARCRALSAEMDRKGPAWVMKNRDYVANRTISNAENLGHRMGVVRRAGVRVMIRTSVRRSR